MKALFFDGDLYMGMREVQQPKPEYKMFAPKNYHIGLDGEPKDQYTTLSTIKMIYRMEDYGERFVIYKLFGYED